MEWFPSYVKELFSGIWGMFSLPWPGFPFTYGQVFLAVLLGSGALGIVLRMVGVNVTGTFGTRGGNNSNIKISKTRSKDTK